MCWAILGPAAGSLGSEAPPSLPTLPPMNSQGPFACLSASIPWGFVPFFQTS